MEVAECRSGNRLSSQKFLKNSALLPSAFPPGCLKKITQHLLQIWALPNTDRVQVLNLKTQPLVEHSELLGRRSLFPTCFRCACQLLIDYCNKTDCVTKAQQTQHESVLRMGPPDMHIDEQLFLTRQQSGLDTGSMSLQCSQAGLPN